MAKNEQDLLWCYNPTTAPFTVKWGGYPYTLASGEKKVYPRFIAEHFAKHLADAILLRKEQKTADATGKPASFVTHPVERPRIINMILLGVYSYFQQQQENPADIIATMVNQQNQGVDAAKAPAAPKEDDNYYEDMGLVPDRAVGTLKEPTAAPPTNLAEEPTNIPEPATENDGSLLPVADAPTPQNTGSTVGGSGGPTPQPTAKPQRTRDELLAEARQLGLEITGKESTARLETMIKNF